MKAMNFSDIIAEGANTFIKEEYSSLLIFLIFFGLFILLCAEH